MAHSSQPASGRRAGRQLAPNKDKAAALLNLQQQAAAQFRADQADDLRERVDSHLIALKHYATTADLIDQLIQRYPYCPKFASMMMDRLMAGDEALANALRSEGV